MSLIPFLPPNQLSKHRMTTKAADYKHKVDVLPMK